MRHRHALRSGHSRTYESWMGMRKRCGNYETKSKSLTATRAFYSERGIKVCERWQSSFIAFLEDMGEAPPGLTLDRIDNNKGYYKENCRWASRLQQSWNSSRAKLICYNGRTMSHRAWAKEIGISQTAFSRRVRLGWPIERVMSAEGQSTARITEPRTQIRAGRGGKRGRK